MIIFYVGGLGSKTSARQQNSKDFFGKFRTHGNTSDLMRLLKRKGHNVHVAFHQNAFSNNTVVTSEVNISNDSIVLKGFDTSNFCDVNSLHSRKSLSKHLPDNRPFPMANNCNLRSLGNKSRQLDLLKYLGYIPTHTLGKYESFRQQNFLNWIEGSNLIYYDKFVVKLSQGCKSNYVLLSSRNEIENNIYKLRNQRSLQNKSATEVLIQPFFKPDIFTSTMGNEIVELRMYSTFSRNGLSDDLNINLVPIGRNISPLDNAEAYKDLWIDLPNTKLPDEVYYLSKQVTQVFADVSRSRIGFLAIDFIMHKGKFYVVEVNTKDPQYPSKNTIAHSSEQITANLAEMLIRD